MTARRAGTESCPYGDSIKCVGAGLRAGPQEYSKIFKENTHE